MYSNCRQRFLACVLVSYRRTIEQIQVGKEEVDSGSYKHAHGEIMRMEQLGMESINQRRLMHLMDRFHTDLPPAFRDCHGVQTIFLIHMWRDNLRYGMVFFMLYMNTRFLGRFFNSPPASQDIRQDIRPKVEGGISEKRRA